MPFFHTMINLLGLQIAGLKRRCKHGITDLAFSVAELSLGHKGDNDE